jgi:DNA-binding winged helix-turn-helix (wHTH) protein
MDRPISLTLRSVDLASEPPFRLGRAQIDPQAHEYTIDNRSTRLQPQTLKVLVALHDKRGQVVTREDLIDRCWSGRIVGDDVINRCISLLRPVASRSGGFAIETIPRSGYRLIELPVAAAGRPAPWRLGSIALAVAALAGVALFAVLRPTVNYHRTLVVDVMPFTAAPGSGAAQLAADAQDSVLRMLTQSGLSVKMASNGGSADGTAADLRVSGVITTNPEGEVATIRVEDLHRKTIIVSHRLQSNLADGADLPERIGANLAAGLSWTGPLLLLYDQNSSDPAFLTQLLDGASNPDGDSLAAFEFDRRNAPNAPNSAVAQLAMAMDTGFSIEGIPLEQRASAVANGLGAADRARQLAPDFGDVYIPWCLLHSPTRRRECEDHLRAGLARDAQAPFVAYFLADLMKAVGRTGDASSLASASLAEDRYVPSKLGLAIELGEALNDTAADGIYTRAVREWPHDDLFFWRRAEGLLLRGDFEALAKFEQDVGPRNFPQGYSSASAIAKAIAAHSLPSLVSACPDRSLGIKAIQCMIGFSHIGQVDDAFRFAAILYRRVHARTPAQDDAIWLARPFVEDPAYLSSPATAAMRRDKRFLALAERVGLLDYWRTGRMPDFCTQAHEPECTAIASR